MLQVVKKCGKKILRTTEFFGFNPLALCHLRYLPRYFFELFKWWRLGGSIRYLHPRLSEYSSVASGVCDGHYFHQDLLVASLIFEHQPYRHLDVGSRVDGFVAHVAAFRRVDVLDIRPLKITGHANINFIQCDFTASDIGEVSDSVSCLHAVEHFGLGRYGDEVDLEGSAKGILNLKRIVTKGGRLYLSCPVSEKDRVEFNAHRVFSPSDITERVCGDGTFVLKEFSLVDDLGRLHRNVEPIVVSQWGVWYGCGIFVFEKL